MTRSLWLMYLCIITVVLSLSVIGIDFYQLCYQPMSVESNSDVLQLKPSETASSFVHSLKSRHLIQSDRQLLLLIRVLGLSQKLKAGIYQIKTGESALQFLYRVAAGDTLIGTFRITEGTTKHQIENSLANALYLHYSSSDWSVVSLHDSSNYEGLLLADTYHYIAGASAKDLLKHAHDNLQQFLEVCWQQRSTNLPYKTPYELLIVASIIEKEAALREEKRLIAGVIVNRLNKRMRLQMDPTVIYALGSQYQGHLSHLDLSIESPYNSYRNLGLPPTPIAMVGKDAILAAAHPQFSEYLYFVAKGDGSHQFSVTYEQQRQAIERYMRKRT